MIGPKGMTPAQIAFWDDLRADEIGRIGAGFATLAAVVRLCLLISLTVSPLLADLAGWLAGLLIPGKSVTVGALTYTFPGVRFALWFGGALVIVLIEALLPGYTIYWQLPFGIFVIFVVVWLRGGLADLLRGRDDQHLGARRHAGRDLRQQVGMDDQRLGGVDRDREANALCAARDGAVDADHLAPLVDQRPAAVARVDGRVGLDEVLVVREAHVGPPCGTDDARGHGVVEAEGVADGQDFLSHHQVVGVTQAQER